MFQRTPPWVLPRNDRPTSTLARSIFARLPPLQRFWRAVQFWYAEAFALGFTVKPKLMGRGQKRSDRYMRSIVKDKALADRMMPMYTMTPHMNYVNPYNPVMGQPRPFLGSI